MTAQDAEKVLNRYLSSGTVEKISGNVVTTAEQWLKQATEELPGVAALLEMKQYRMTYRTAYDLIRNAAEAVITKAGYRVTSAQGHHEAVFALANSLVCDFSGAFDGKRSAQSRGMRSKAQYIDLDRSTEVDAHEAATAYQWAQDAVVAAKEFLG